MRNPTRLVGGAITRRRLWQFFIENNQTFLPLSETEHNGNFQDHYSCHYQDLMTFASYTGNTRLMPKANFLSSFPASLTSKGTCIKAQSGLNASMPEEVHQYLSNWKAHSAPGTMNSYLKNLCHIYLKAATLGKQTPWFSPFSRIW